MTVLLPPPPETILSNQSMGCGASKVEDLPLVTLCRERKHLIRSAADHRFALASAHFSYFRHLSSVADSLCRFVDEELLVSLSSSSPSSPSSTLSSPVLTLPSDLKKKKMKKPVSESNNLGSSHSHLPLSSSDSEHHHDHHHGDHDDHDGHLDIDDYDDDDETEIANNNSKPTPGPSPSTSFPQPGISYIPQPTSNYPPFDPYYPGPHQFPHHNNDNSYYYADPNINPSPYYPPQMNSFINGGGYDRDLPNYGYYDPSSSTSYYPENGGDSNIYGASTSYGSNTTAYYMKKSSTRIPSVIYQEPRQNPIYTFSDSQANYPPSEGYFASGNVGYPNYTNGGNTQNEQQQERRPPTPPSPKVSAWDFFNPFEGGGVYTGYDSNQGSGNGYGYGYGYGSNTSSPDSREVREREGIPELEEETESEVIKEPYDGERRRVEEGGFGFPERKKRGGKNKTVQFEDWKKGGGSNGSVNGNGNGNGKKKKNGSDDFGEGTSKAVPVYRKEEPEMFREEPEPFQEPGPEMEPEPVEVREVKSSSPDTEISTSMSTDEVSVKKKGVSFDMGGGSHLDMESSKPSSLTTLSAHGTRDLREVVREIKDEFEAATDYGKEVSVLLEVGKEPYKSRNTFLKVMARVCSTSLSSFQTPSNLDGRHPGDPEDDFDSRSLATTLEKLYFWEKKLYKEVKDEERLRVMYEKQCKKLKTLDDIGAESTKIEATQASIRKLLTKINVSVRAVDSISSRIHKLRDDELRPQLKELIYGLRRMWKLMLKCHQKQFQAILESKTRALRANTGSRRDSSVRATIQLEAELLKWSHRFNNWIEMQRSYAETLNGWLKKCLHYEPEITADGEVPFSPGRLGAPPVFVICHDWKQAMERVSESEVQTAMGDFATSLHQLWERQDEEQRKRLKAESMYKDFEKQIRTIRMERQRRGGHENDDALSDKNSLSMVTSESGVSPLDDLKVDLDSMRQRVKEERAGHKEAVKLVHDAVSRSIQAGLIPIFEALESFTSEATKAFDDVRLEHESGGS